MKKKSFHKWARPIGCLTSLLAAGVLAGCSGFGPKAGTPPVSAQDRVPLPSVYPALRGTVGQFATLTYAGPLVVRGWGLVAGLPNTGSGQMPPPIRRLMLDRLLKSGVGFYTHGTGNIDPNQILASREVAAVAVEGAIPPLAVRGTTFDLYLKALPNTGTTSLENGLLWPTNLRVHIRISDQSQVVARGRGPVFCDPFDADGKLKPRSAINREGRVIGGAVVEKSMPVVLELYNPSYRITDLIQRVINQHYGNYPAVATAENDRVVTLRIIRGYRHKPLRFVRRVLELYLAGNVPGFNLAQAKVIIKALGSDAAAPRPALAAALEQLGRPIIPFLQKYYNSGNAAVAYYCLQAGARLGDSDALQGISLIAQDTASPFQRRAIYTLIKSKDRFLAGVTFRKLLDSASRRVQVMGYKGLLSIHSSMIYSQAVGQKFVMDILPCKIKSLIYVTSHNLPRIAFIGRIPTLMPGSLYISPHNALTVNYPPAAKGSTTQPAQPVDLYYRDPLSGKTVSMKCGTALPAIITALAGSPNPFSPKFNPREPFIGISYQRVIRLLYMLCHTGQVNGEFRMETITGKNRELLASLNQPRPSRSTAVGITIAPTTRPTNAPFSTSLPGELPAGDNAGGQ